MQQHNMTRKKNFSCNRCGYEHEKDRCPAREKTCNYCGIIGHFRKACFKLKKANSVKLMENSEQLADGLEEVLYSLKTVKEVGDSKKSFATIAFFNHNRKKCEMPIGHRSNSKCDRL